MQCIRALKTINYKLFFAIFATLFLPTIYQTIRIYFLGALPNDSDVNIASQLSWVNLLYEVLQEAFILPLFYLLGKSLQNKAEFSNKMRTGLLFIASIYILFSILLCIFARPLVKAMAQEQSLIDATVTYIRLESIAAVFLILWRFISLALIVLKKRIFYIFY